MSWKRTILRLGRRLLLLVVLVVCGLFVVAQVRRAALRRDHAAPGERIEVGGQNLHVVVRGRGGPTVVFEAGAGEFGLVWSPVAEKVAEFATVVVYDRAGFGWSDPAPGGTAVDPVGSLRQLLATRQLAPPYILVGHSLGGLRMRAFAARWPETVGGLLLVDATHEQQFARLPERFVARAKGQAAGFATAARVLAVVADSGLLALAPAVIPAMPGLTPPEQAAYRARIVVDGTFLRSVLKEQLDALAAEPVALRPLPPRLADVPLIVLAHGRAEMLPDEQLLAAEIERSEIVWQELQGELAALSTRGRMEVVGGTGHHVHLERPDAVVAAIRELVWKCSADPRAADTKRPE